MRRLRGFYEPTHEGSMALVIRDLSEEGAVNAATQIPEGFDKSIEQPVTREYASKDGIGIVQCDIPNPGTFIPQHSHEYDHITLITVGSLRVWKDGVFDKDYHAPTMISIPACVKHTFMSLVPKTVFYCIHRTDRSGKIDIHEEHQLPGLHKDDEVI